MSRVYKILDAAEWDEAFRRGVFAGSEVDLGDGYIHLSTAAQAAETARLHFRGRADLVVLELETDDLEPHIRWEPSRHGALFPHLYGHLDPARVRAVHGAPLDAEGVPQLPDLPA